uniref:Uncharacterized protein n=1 Tax=Physcomitrium patens TaxID=3218 RepID=A0A2K1L742_PHYPA|nr:hypothetical protein PHYPA_000284 [Physcomitrium patens]
MVQIFFLSRLLLTAVFFFFFLSLFFFSFSLSSSLDCFSSGLHNQLKEIWLVDNLSDRDLLQVTPQ